MTNRYTHVTLSPIRLENVSITPKMSFARQSLQPGNNCSDFHCRLVLLVLECHINGIMQHALFCVWVLSLGIMSVRVIRAYQPFLFYHCARSIVWMVHMHSPVDGNLECFQFGAIRNNVDVNLHVPVFLWAYVCISLM